MSKTNVKPGLSPHEVVSLVGVDVGALVNTAGAAGAWVGDIVVVLGPVLHCLQDALQPLFTDVFTQYFSFLFSELLPFSHGQPRVKPMSKTNVKSGLSAQFFVDLEGTIAVGVGAFLVLFVDFIGDISHSPQDSLQWFFTSLPQYFFFLFSEFFPFSHAQSWTFPMSNSNS